MKVRGPFLLLGICQQISWWGEGSQGLGLLFPALRNGSAAYQGSTAPCPKPRSFQGLKLSPAFKYINLKGQEKVFPNQLQFYWNNSYKRHNHTSLPRNYTYNNQLYIRDCSLKYLSLIKVQNFFEMQMVLTVGVILWYF